MKIKVNVNITTILLLIILFAYTAFISNNQINQHRCFLNSVGHDTAGYNQTVWNTLHGKSFYNSISHMEFTREYVQLGDHFNLIIIFLLPIYIFYQTYEWLLILQTAAIAATALMLYLLCCQQIKDRNMGFLLALGLLSSPMLMKMHLYGVRPEYYSPLLIFVGLYCLFKNKAILYFILLFLALLCKESIPLVGMAIGVYVLFNNNINNNRIIGSCTIIIALAYFILVTMIIMPPIRVGGYLHDVTKTTRVLLSEYGWQELKLNFTRFNKPYELYLMFRSTLILPFISPAVILVIPGLLQFLVKNVTWNVWNHILLIPYIYLSAVFGARIIKNTNTILYKWTKILLCCSVLIFNILPSIKGFTIFKPTEVNLYFHELKRRYIPDSASVITQMYMTPDFSSREIVHWMDFKSILSAEDFENKKVDYIFFGVHRAYSEHGPREIVSLINFTRDTTKYKLIVADRGYLIFKHKSLIERDFNDYANRQLAENWLRQVLSYYL
jgi:uncharacterized membrane protein